MTNGSGVSGDRNRNARLARLRELVPLERAIVGIDLADTKQMVVDDHDSRVLARRTFRYYLGPAFPQVKRHSQENGRPRQSLSQQRVRGSSP